LYAVCTLYSRERGEKTERAGVTGGDKEEKEKREKTLKPSLCVVCCHLTL
jgi:hypothetical protein